MSQLKIIDLKKKYKNKQVIQGVSFSVKSGQVVGLLGPNGAGKTTCFYTVLGIVPVDEGDITIGDKSLAQMPMYKRARNGISYLPQEPSIFRNMTVSENILVALEIQGHSHKRRQTKLRQLLEDFQIDQIKDSYGYSLSGGERRRVEIARSLAGSPKFLLLDEPFAGIDPIVVADIQGIITRLKEKNIGILVTDHNVRETLGVCDYTYILKDGRIQVEGTAQEIANSETARKFYLGENFKL